jgi:hypothetical protein
MREKVECVRYERQKKRQTERRNGDKRRKREHREHREREDGEIWLSFNAAHRSRQPIHWPWEQLPLSVIPELTTQVDDGQYMAICSSALKRSTTGN